MSMRFARHQLNSADETAPDGDASLKAPATDGDKSYGSATCPLCFGTEMHVVLGRRAKRCDCRAEESR
jgi:hypothetical protein